MMPGSCTGDMRTRKASSEGSDESIAAAAIALPRPADLTIVVASDNQVRGSQLIDRGNETGLIRLSVCGPCDDAKSR
jgi:hypothetical protein